MELYTFGLNCPFQPRQGSSTNRTGIPAQTATLRADRIKVLWSSWCDAIFAHRPSSQDWVIQYHGTGLTDRQSQHIANDCAVKHALGDEINESIEFFGTALHDGLRGYVISNMLAATSSTTLFATNLEIEDGLPEIQHFQSTGEPSVNAIRLGSGDDVFISEVWQSSHRVQVIHLGQAMPLRRHLSAKHRSTQPLQTTNADILQWCVNSTAATLLNRQGEVLTATHDARYSKCLGRAFTGSAAFEPVPYLSETTISTIASGGFMTAALSSDGELYLWGQACPGAVGELKVLVGGPQSLGSQRESQMTSITADDDQDDNVACLMTRIDGMEARVYQVAVGHGHVVVAAEVETLNSPPKRVVFVAGDNSKGQLGLGDKKDFVDVFEEVVWLRGKKVEQLQASGWLTAIVVHE